MVWEGFKTGLNMFMKGLRKLKKMKGFTKFMKETKDHEWVEKPNKIVFMLYLDRQKAQ